jgi:hypothetical protein
VADMIVAFQSEIKIFYNPRQLQSSTDFCNPSYRTISFQPPGSSVFNTTGNINTGILQIKDINIDGYPDIMLPVVLNVSNKEQYVQLLTSN